MTKIVAHLGDKALKLTTEFRGWSLTTVKWYKENQELTNNGKYSMSVEDSVAELNVIGISKHDEGTYTLVASSPNGETLLCAEVCVEEMIDGRNVHGEIHSLSPILIQPLTDQVIRVGRKAKLTVAASHPEVQIQWYKGKEKVHDNEKFQVSHQGGVSTLDINIVEPSDEGIWRCEVIAAFGYAISLAKVQTIVPKGYRKPEFLEPLKALLTEQGTVSLECKVVGVPTPQLKWYKDGNEIKAGDMFNLRLHGTDENSLGTYTCLAVNCMGKAVSSAQVTVTEKADDKYKTKIKVDEPIPFFFENLADKTIRVGDNFRFTVRVRTPPSAQIAWFRNNDLVEASDKFHLSQVDDGIYHLDVSPIEYDDQGQWRCTATNQYGHNSLICNLQIIIPKNYRSPEFVEDLQAIFTDDGLVSFECKVIGVPTPILKWYKDGAELKPGDVHLLSGSNSLGSYSCLAKNCMGFASSYAELTLDDIYGAKKRRKPHSKQPPRFIQPLKDDMIILGTPYTFTVIVTCPPVPEVTWYKDNQLVDGSGRYKVRRERNGVYHLEVGTAESADQGLWKCLIANDYGHSLTQCSLRVTIPKQFKKPVFIENLRAVLSEEGAVSLECKVVGVPQPLLKWYKDGVELKAGDIYKIVSGEGGTSCLGTYTCEARNCMGVATSTAALLAFDDKNLKDNFKDPYQQDLSTIEEKDEFSTYGTPSITDNWDDYKTDMEFSIYDTPDITENEAKQIIEMFANEASEYVSMREAPDLPPFRFIKESAMVGNILMEALIIDVPLEHFSCAEDMSQMNPVDNLATEADIADFSTYDPVIVDLPYDYSDAASLHELKISISEGGAAVKDVSSGFKEAVIVEINAPVAFTDLRSVETKSPVEPTVAQIETASALEPVVVTAACSNELLNSSLREEEIEKQNAQELQESAGLENPGNSAKQEGPQIEQTSQQLKESIEEKMKAIGELQGDYRDYYSEEYNSPSENLGTEADVDSIASMEEFAADYVNGYADDDLELQELEVDAGAGVDRLEESSRFTPTYESAIDDLNQTGNVLQINEIDYLTARTPVPENPYFDDQQLLDIAYQENGISNLLLPEAEVERVTARASPSLLTELAGSVLQKAAESIMTGAVLAESLVAMAANLVLPTNEQGAGPSQHPFQSFPEQQIDPFVTAFVTQTETEPAFQPEIEVEEIKENKQVFPTEEKHIFQTGKDTKSELEKPNSEGETIFNENAIDKSLGSLTIDPSSVVVADTADLMFPLVLKSIEDMSLSVAKDAITTALMNLKNEISTQENIIRSLQDEPISASSDLSSLTDELDHLKSKKKAAKEIEQKTPIEEEKQVYLNENVEKMAERIATDILDDILPTVAEQLSSKLETVEVINEARKYDQEINYVTATNSDQQINKINEVSAQSEIAEELKSSIPAISNEVQNVQLNKLAENLVANSIQKGILESASKPQKNFELSTKKIEPEPQKNENKEECSITQLASSIENESTQINETPDIIEEKIKKPKKVKATKTKKVSRENSETPAQPFVDDGDKPLVLAAHRLAEELVAKCIVDAFGSLEEVLALLQKADMQPDTKNAQLTEKNQLNVSATVDVDATIGSQFFTAKLVNKDEKEVSITDKVETVVQSDTEIPKQEDLEVPKHEEVSLLDNNLDNDAAAKLNQEECLLSLEEIPKSEGSKESKLRRSSRKEKRRRGSKKLDESNRQDSKDSSYGDYTSDDGESNCSEAMALPTSNSNKKYTRTTSSTDLGQIHETDEFGSELSRRRSLPNIKETNFDVANLADLEGELADVEAKVHTANGGTYLSNDEDLNKKNVDKSSAADLEQTFGDTQVSDTLTDTNFKQTLTAEHTLIPDDTLTQLITQPNSNEGKVQREQFCISEEKLEPAISEVQKILPVNDALEKSQNEEHLIPTEIPDLIRDVNIEQIAKTNEEIQNQQKAIKNSTQISNLEEVAKEPIESIIEQQLNFSNLENNAEKPEVNTLFQPNLSNESSNLEVRTPFDTTVERKDLQQIVEKLGENTEDQPQSLNLENLIDKPSKTAVEENQQNESINLEQKTNLDKITGANSKTNENSNAADQKKSEKLEIKVIQDDVSVTEEHTDKQVSPIPLECAGDVIKLKSVAKDDDVSKHVEKTAKSGESENIDPQNSESLGKQSNIFNKNVPDLTPNDINQQIIKQKIDEESMGTPVAVKVNEAQIEKLNYIENSTELIDELKQNPNKHSAAIEMIQIDGASEICDKSTEIVQQPVENTELVETSTPKPNVVKETEFINENASSQLESDNSKLESLNLTIETTLENPEVVQNGDEKVNSIAVSKEEKINNEAENKDISECSTKTETAKEILEEKLTNNQVQNTETEKIEPNSKTFTETTPKIETATENGKINSISEQYTDGNVAILENIGEKLKESKIIQNAEAGEVQQVEDDSKTFIDTTPNVETATENLEINSASEQCSVENVVILENIKNQTESEIQNAETGEVQQVEDDSKTFIDITPNVETATENLEINSASEQCSVENVVILENIKNQTESEIQNAETGKVQQVEDDSKTFIDTTPNVETATENLEINSASEQCSVENVVILENIKNQTESEIQNAETGEVQQVEDDSKTFIDTTPNVETATKNLEINSTSEQCTVGNVVILENIKNQTESEIQNEETGKVEHVEDDSKTFVDIAKIIDTEISEQCAVENVVILKNTDEKQGKNIQNIAEIPDLSSTEKSKKSLEEHETSKDICEVNTNIETNQRNEENMPQNIQTAKIQELTEIATEAATENRENEQENKNLELAAEAIEESSITNSCTIKETPILEQHEEIKKEQSIHNADTRVLDQTENTVEELAPVKSYSPESAAASVEEASTNESCSIVPSVSIQTAAMTTEKTEKPQIIQKAETSELNQAENSDEQAKELVNLINERETAKETVVKGSSKEYRVGEAVIVNQAPEVAKQADIENENKTHPEKSDCEKPKHVQITDKENQNVTETTTEGAIQNETAENNSAMKERIEPVDQTNVETIVANENEQVTGKQWVDAVTKEKQLIDEEKQMTQVESEQKITKNDKNAKTVDSYATVEESEANVNKENSQGETIHQNELNNAEAKPANAEPTKNSEIENKQTKIGEVIPELINEKSEKLSEETKKDSKEVSNSEVDNDNKTSPETKKKKVIKKKTKVIKKDSEEKVSSEPTTPDAKTAAPETKPEDQLETKEKKTTVTSEQTNENVTDENPVKTNLDENSVNISEVVLSHEEVQQLNEEVSKRENQLVSEIEIQEEPAKSSKKSTAKLFGRLSIEELETGDEDKVQHSKQNGIVTEPSSEETIKPISNGTKFRPKNMLTIEELLADDSPLETFVQNVRTYSRLRTINEVHEISDEMEDEHIVISALTPTWVENDDTKEHSSSTPTSSTPTLTKHRLTRPSDSSNPKGQYSPQFIMKLKDLTIPEQYRMRLTCCVIGTPEPKVDWLKNGQPITSEMGCRQINDLGICVLEIPFSSVNDSAEYTCIACNEYGETSTTGTLTVKKGCKTVEVEPIPTRQVIDAKGSCGDSITMDCSVTGWPTPQVTWLKNEEVVKSGDRVERSDYPGGAHRLVINSAAVEDTGVYKCVATNHLGKDEVVTSIRVTGRRPSSENEGSSLSKRPSRPSFITKPHNRVVREGETVKFSCSVIGHPVPKTQWCKDGSSLLISSGNIQLSDKDDVHSLTITDITTSDAGIYSIAASNSMGKILATAKLDVVATSRTTISTIRECRTDYTVDSLRRPGSSRRCYQITGFNVPQVLYPSSSSSSVYHPSAHPSSFTPSSYTRPSSSYSTSAYSFPSSSTSASSYSHHPSTSLNATNRSRYTSRFT